MFHLLGLSSDQEGSVGRVGARGQSRVYVPRTQAPELRIILLWSDGVDDRNLDDADRNQLARL